MANKKAQNEKKSIQVMADASIRYTQLPTEQIIESIIDEMEAMLVERTKEAREYTIRVYWEAGQMLRAAEKEHRVNITNLVFRVAHDNRIGDRQMRETNLWLALKIFDKYPTFEKVYDTEHGENISLSKLKKDFSVPKPKKDPSIDEIASQIYNKLGPDKTEKLIKALQKILNKD